MIKHDFAILAGKLNLSILAGKFDFAVSAKEFDFLVLTEKHYFAVLMVKHIFNSGRKTQILRVRQTKHSFLVSAGKLDFAVSA